jgi:hypothetical protein
VRKSNDPEFGRITYQSSYKRVYNAAEMNIQVKIKSKPTID